MTEANSAAHDGGAARAMTPMARVLSSRARGALPRETAVPGAFAECLTGGGIGSDQVKAQAAGWETSSGVSR
jgi:hypothetical protein